MLIEATATDGTCVTIRVPYDERRKASIEILPRNNRLQAARAAMVTSGVQIFNGDNTGSNPVRDAKHLIHFPELNSCYRSDQSTTDIDVPVAAKTSATSGSAILMKQRTTSGSNWVPLSAISRLMASSTETPCR